MQVSLIRWVLLGALGWIGCDPASPTVLPRCLDGQGLATDSAGNFQCTAVQPPTLPATPLVMGCATGAALAYTENAPHLTCIDKMPGAGGTLTGALLREYIQDTERRLASLGESVAQLQMMPLTKEALYVGSTSMATTGRITTAGKTGLLAAHALCAAQFGTHAHMCTQFQLTRTLAVGKLGPKDYIAPAWIYMPTWHNPGSSTTEPLSGLADNCGGYTTGDDTAGWTGMAVEWSPLASGDVVFRWHGGTEAPCSASLPIACCAGGS